MTNDEKPGSTVEDVNGIAKARQASQPDEYVGYGFKKDKSPWVKFKAPLVGEIRFNPVVSFTSIILIWSFVTWCIIEKENVPFKAWKAWIVQTFTWLYIGSQDLWALFAIVLYFSKYSNLKLGKPNDKPEFNDVTWFVMLFACGIGVGLIFYGVAEPIYHYTGKNRYTADPTLPDNTAAQIAINITLYHWGIHGWIVYCLVGLLLGLMAYRENLPMTMKSCFYPIIGDQIFGWLGDAIDIVSVLTTLFGVCTSLGLGTRQLNVGLNLMNSDIDPNNITYQVAIIWCITAIATISTVSGVGMGIRRLSEICFGFGMFLMMVALFMDDTFYLFNLAVQSLGYYTQYIIQLGWHTDAFEQLGTSAHQSLGRFVAPGHDQPDGPPEWMDDWTMFYWGWWISWSPFVGMFIAKISRGRTIKQFINGTLTAPVIYSILWMVIFGGAGIRMERESSNLGYCCNPGLENGSMWFVNATEARSSIIGNAALGSPLSADATWLCTDGACGSCATSILEKKASLGATFGDFIGEYEALGKDIGSANMDRSVSKVSCHGLEQMWFDVMRSYGDIGQFLSLFSLITIVLYFVTSSDSGSLVIDCLTANGDPDPPKIQRVFWALMEGATATALLVAGGKEGIKALQTAGIVSGLPYTVVICLLCVALWRAVKVAAGDMDPFGPKFEVSLFEPFGSQPYKGMKAGQTFNLFLKVVGNVFIAPWTLGQVMARLNSSDRVWAYAMAPGLSFVLFILFLVLDVAWYGCWAIGWFFYLCFVTIITSVRIKCRDRFGICGNPFEDFFASLFLYPNTIVQMDEATGILGSMPSDAEKNMEGATNAGYEKEM